ncbi:heparinase II/III family protein [Bordetella petrii]|uniref:heparinase II/III domain-containing protein n=1 Tax=Bordetella petrii TaxID=94624 RepID=UPI0038B40CA3
MNDAQPAHAGEEKDRDNSVEQPPPMPGVAPLPDEAGGRPAKDPPNGVTLQLVQPVGHDLPITPPRPGGPIKCAHLHMVLGQSCLQEDGNALLYKPRKDVDFYRLDLPLDWNMDPFSDENWRGQLHMWRMLDFLMPAFEKALDPAPMRHFIDIVRDWHRYHIAEQQASRFAWKDMMVGLRAMKLAYIVSQWQHGLVQVAPSDVVCLDEMVKAHLAFMLDRKNVRFNNHTLSDLVGARALAEVVAPATADEIERFVDEVFVELLKRQFTEDGVHRENSTGYQKFALEYLQKLRRSGWFDKYGLNEVVAKAKRVLPWFVMPDGRVAPIGDTGGAAPSKNAEKPWFSGQNQVFNSSGYVIVRSDGQGEMRDASYFFFAGASHTIAHKQADDLSFIWYHGEDILCDPGKYGYTNDDNRRYVISRPAHNTVTIDSPKDGRGAAGLYGSAVREFSSHDWGHYLSAAVDFKGLAYRHERYCFYSVEGWLLVMDKISSPVHRDFSQWSHFAPQIVDFVAVSHGYQATLPSGRKLGIRIATTHPCETKLIRGATTPSLQGWTSQSYNQVEPSTAMQVRQQDGRISFATLYSLDDVACQIGFVGDNALACSMQGGQRKLQIQITESGCQVTTS